MSVLKDSCDGVEAANNRALGLTMTPPIKPEYVPIFGRRSQLDIAAVETHHRQLMPERGWSCLGK